MSSDRQRVARVNDLHSERGTRVCIRHDGKETPVLLVRDGDNVRAYSADCPHAGAPLEQGTICNGRLICPWHKGTFELRDGSLVEPPPLKALTRYETTVRDGDVYVSAVSPLSAAPREAPRQCDERGSSAQRTVLIAGAGAAGAAASAALREAGFAGRIVLAGGDARQPYDRTSLSKFVVAGDMPVDDIPPLLDPDFFSRQQIERVEARVTRLDADARRAELANGTALDYDAALVCTGGTPKPLDLPGADLAHVHLLRSRDDARAILASLERAGTQGAAKRAAIVGASFIGLEVAACLRKRHIDVHVICPTDVPFARQFGACLGERIRRLHEENGVTFHTRAQVKALGGTDGGEAVREVVLDTGERLPIDVVIAGTGIVPATSFLSGVQLNDDRSVTVDAGMRVAPGLYAAGDVARFPLPRTGEQVRIEHWRVAQQLARVAALNIAGEPREYVGVPYFWTYHYGKTVDYLGHVDQPDSVEIGGDLDGMNFIAYLVKEGRLGAVVACERSDAIGRLAEAMREPLTLEDARRIAEA